MAQSDVGTGKTGPDQKLVAAGTLLLLLTVLVLITSGVGTAVGLLGLVVLAIGAVAVVRGQAHWARIVSRRAGAAVLGAGFVVMVIGGALSPSTQEAASATPAPTSSAPTTSAAPSSTSAAPRAALVAPAPTTSQAPVLPAAPVMAVTCPAAGTTAAPVFGQQITAAAPFTVVIDYGDGDQYQNDDKHLDAVFSHTYKAPGTYVVKAVLTDVAGQSVAGSCTYTWTAPAAPARVVAPSGGDSAAGGSSSGSTGGGSTSGGSGSGAGARGSVSYANCDAVRAAGAAPIHPGDPGFQAKFDKDNDGIGCE